MTEARPAGVADAVAEVAAGPAVVALPTALVCAGCGHRVPDEAPLALACPAAAHDFTAGMIEIGHPWSRPTPPSAPVASGYMKLTNNGTEADRLTAISSPFAQRAEIHRSVVTDGVASMRPAEGLSVMGDDLFMTAPASERILADGGRLEIQTHAGLRSAWITPGLQSPVRLSLRGLGLPARGSRPAGRLIVTLEPCEDTPSAAEDLLMRFNRVWTPERLAA